MRHPFHFLSFLAIPLIFLAALLQGLGFSQQLEKGLLHLLPMHLRPEAPRIILLSLEKGAAGDSPLDVAMVLRGLTQFHPECVIVNGKIEPEQGTVPLLPSILARLTNHMGITLILPESPSPETLFRSVPLVRYSLSEKQSDWPILSGRSGPGTGAAYLPKDQPIGNHNLPLLAKSSDGATIGSLWWWCLPWETRTHPPFLLCDTILLLANHAPLHLTSSGEVSQSGNGETFREIPLDDFLLKIEQKERGVISPTFDSLWKNATVVLGTHDDSVTISMLAALLQAIFFRRLPLWSQTMMIRGWMFLFFLIKNRRGGIDQLPRWLLPLLITLIVIFTTLFLMHQGIIIPFLPGIVTALLLLL